MQQKYNFKLKLEISHIFFLKFRFPYFTVNSLIVFGFTFLVKLLRLTLSILTAEYIFCSDEEGK